jgi:AraC family transcriptional regulator
VPGGGADVIERTTPGGTMVRVVRYGPGSVQRRHAHERSSMSLVVRGRIEERVGRATEVAGPLSVVVKPAGTEHADTFGLCGAAVLQVILSPEDEARIGEVGCALRAWRWSHADGAVRPLLTLLRSVVEPELERSEIVEDLVIEVLACLNRPPRTGDPPRWLLRARECLDEESASIRALAATHGVHPVHLAREFRRHFGLSPTEHRRRGRLRRAARFLADSDVTLADAALAAGYADQAHMTRELHAAAGLTPRGLRRVTTAA